MTARIPSPDADALTRLFVYGTLQPGEPNARVLAPLGGRWQPAQRSDRPLNAGVPSS